MRYAAHAGERDAAAFIREFVQPAVDRYRAGDKERAVDTFFRGVFGSDYRDSLEPWLPGALDQAISDADAFLTQELPALQQWSFTEEDAKRIPQPVLAVAGEKSSSTFPERRELLLSWLPNADPSNYRARRTSSTCRTRAGCPRHSRRSSPATRSQRDLATRD
jgi:hypothetical protein